MEDDESFDEFYAKPKDMVNLAFNLGETIPEPKIVSGAVELDWMWLCRRFEVGLEEKKLKSGATELDWKRMIG